MHAYDFLSMSPAVTQRFLLREVDWISLCFCAQKQKPGPCFRRRAKQCKRGERSSSGLKHEQRVHCNFSSLVRPGRSPARGHYMFPTCIPVPFWRHLRVRHQRGVVFREGHFDVPCFVYLPRSIASSTVRKSVLELLRAS